MASMMDKRLSDALLTNTVYHTDLFAISYVQELRKIADALEGIRAALDEKNKFAFPGTLPILPLPVQPQTHPFTDPGPQTTTTDNTEVPAQQSVKRRKN